MDHFSLYDRITQHGTLSEPKGVPDPYFALQGTVNWMRALALLVDDTGLDFGSARDFYTGTNSRKFTVHQENSVFEQVTLALHQLSALESMRSHDRRADVARVGAVAWYYGIYYAASAMVAAQDGSLQENHTKTAVCWDKLLASRDLVMEPFSLRVSTLVERDAKCELEALKSGQEYRLIHAPLTTEQAHDACCAYLSGSVRWWGWKIGETIKQSREFKDLGVSNFRKKIAGELRDKTLAKKSVSFLHQASRYRGKANYREALFLAYGKDVETHLTDYIDDMTTVLEAFVAMAGAFCSRRLPQPIWDEFVHDLETHRSFTVSPNSIWSCA